MLEEIAELFFFKKTLTAQAMYDSCVKKPCNNFTALKNKIRRL